MINNTTILSCFDELVGWRESNDAGSIYEELTTSLQTSDSGVYVNDIPGVTLEIINDIVGRDNSSVNSYLANRHSSAIIELMNNFIRSQKVSNYTKSLLKNQDSGIVAQNVRTTVPKNSRFVGFMIQPMHSNSISAEILQFGGMFDTLQSDLPIYFYSSQQLDPIAVYYTDITKTNSTVWFTLNGTGSGSGSTATNEDPIQFICDYINTSNGHGQQYYIGYYEDDLTGNAIDTQVPCASCDGGIMTMWNAGKYAVISPIEIAAGNTYGSRELFDIDAIGIGSQTYGLMLQMNIRCDISNVVCDNKILFANVLAKKIASMIMWDAYNSTNLNANSATKRETFRLFAEKYESELNGYVQDGRRVKGEIEMLNLDFSNLDKICLGKSKGSLGIGAL